VFLLGQWRNYDDLEESFTLDELTLTYNAIMDRENDRREFEIRLSGGEIDEQASSPQQPEQKQESTLEQRVRERLEQEREQRAREQGKTSFAGDKNLGLGYRVIGG
jgi:spore cortex formation protein SpoVR/YcgB (stage V sporulation)